MKFDDEYYFSMISKLLLTFYEQKYSFLLISVKILPSLKEMILPLKSDLPTEAQESFQVLIDTLERIIGKFMHTKKNKFENKRSVRKPFKA